MDEDLKNKLGGVLEYRPIDLLRGSPKPHSIAVVCLQLVLALNEQIKAWGLFYFLIEIVS